MSLNNKKQVSKIKIPVKEKSNSLHEDLKEIDRLAKIIFDWGDYNYKEEAMKIRKIVALHLEK